MTSISTETTNTDEFDFTAAYGTAIVAVRARLATSARNDDWRAADGGSLIEHGDGLFGVGNRSRLAQQ